MIREAKKGLNQGRVKRQVEEVMYNKTVLKKVERKSGDVIWGSIAFLVVAIVCIRVFKRSN
jgi:hypothetical protein